MTHTVKVHRIPEHPVAGKPLGRHVWHDSRSWGYPVTSGAALRTVLWARRIAILNQLKIGSCTGNALTGGLGTLPLFDALPIGHPALDEAEALTLYAAATALDGYPGTFTYPPPGGEDTGSDGLSVCKAGVAAGLLSGYTHAFSLDAALAALTAGPVLFGISWYDSFDKPGPHGLVGITSGAQVRGGHEVLGRGIDVDSQLVYLDNSWGEDWADSGSFEMSWATLDRLLAEDGDATVPVPATVPAPVPTPVPPTPIPDSPSAGDVTLWQGTEGWANARHYTRATKDVAGDLKTWAHAKGFYGA